MQTIWYFHVYVQKVCWVMVIVKLIICNYRMVISAISHLKQLNHQLALVKHFVTVHPGDTRHVDIIPVGTPPGRRQAAV